MSLQPYGSSVTNSEGSKLLGMQLEGESGKEGWKLICWIMAK